MSDSTDTNTPEETTGEETQTTGDGFSAEELEELQAKAGDGPIVDGEGRNVFTAEQLAEMAANAADGVMKDSQGREIFTKEQLAAKNS